MEIAPKNLSAKQVVALTELLSQARYLSGSMKYNPSEFVVRETCQKIAIAYQDLTK